MTDWKKVNGSQEKRPSEIDTTTSAVYVYQRRNIGRITVDNGDDSSTELWQYDERQMTHEEYNELRIAQNSADIDYIAMEIGVEL